MQVITTALTVGPDENDPVVPRGTVGEIVGDGYTAENGIDYICVDFGNIACDVQIADLEVISAENRNLSKAW